jgi:hypothetical protein
MVTKKQGGIKFESNAAVFRKRSQWLNDSAHEYAFFMYWGRWTKIDTALYLNENDIGSDGTLL